MFVVTGPTQALAAPSVLEHGIYQPEVSSNGVRHFSGKCRSQKALVRGDLKDLIATATGVPVTHVRAEAIYAAQYASAAYNTKVRFLLSPPSCLGLCSPVVSSCPHLTHVLR